MATTTAIRFENVTRQFPGQPAAAIEGVNLTADAGQFVSVVGPSGCGKSTLLNLAAGLDRPTHGTVKIRGGPLEGRNQYAAYMFQQDALLPWKTAIENIALGLIFRGVGAAEAEKQAQEWIGRVGLRGFERSFPSQLSGGMRKRAAMAQCWITDPDMLLMDEPFSALDVHLRLRMGSELLDLWTSSPKTVLFVTHDLEEAIALADEVVVLSSGPGSRVIGRYSVDLPRPRNLIDIRTDERFRTLYGEIWTQLKEEVLRSYEK